MLDIKILENRYPEFQILVDFTIKPKSFNRLSDFNILES